MHHKHFIILRLSSLLFIAMFTFSMAMAQQSSLASMETKMTPYARNILAAKDDFVKISSSDSLLNMLTVALKTDGSFDYPFDSLVNISRLKADDGHFRIITWAIPKQDGSYDFAGLIQLRLKDKSFKLIVLTDHSSEIENPENQVLSPENWYGALYYKVITNQYNRTTFYTLLGWDGNNSLSKKKLIEILTIKPNNELVFGFPAFSKFPRKVKRVIFEYASNSNMTLNYDYQNIIKKERKGKKVKIVETPGDLIVFDRLGPMHPSLEGQYQFYVPETNIFDGFVFENGKWTYVKEVDARNVDKKKKTRKKKLDLELFPPPEPEKN